MLSALRAMACNDAVKDAIVRAGGTETIVATMTRHLTSPQVRNPLGEGNDGVAGLPASAHLWPPSAGL